MPRWSIQGADRATGKDLSFEVDAADEAAAIREAGKRAFISALSRYQEPQPATPAAATSPVVSRVEPPPQVAQLSLAEGEQIFYQGVGVIVTSRRLITRIATYSMANLVSVRVVNEPPETAGWTTLLILCAFFGFCTLGVKTDRLDVAAGVWVARLAIVGAIVIAASRIRNAASTRFSAIVSMSSGEITVDSGLDRREAISIFEAINRAIAAG